MKIEGYEQMTYEEWNCYLGENLVVLKIEPKFEGCYQKRTLYFKRKKEVKENNGE